MANNTGGAAKAAIDEPILQGPDNPDHFPFISLFPEIRNMIYKEYFKNLAAQPIPTSLRRRLVGELEDGRRTFPTVRRETTNEYASRQEVVILFDGSFRLPHPPAALSLTCKEIFKETWRLRWNYRPQDMKIVAHVCHHNFRPLLEDGPVNTILPELRSRIGQDNNTTIVLHGEHPMKLQGRRENVKWWMKKVWEKRYPLFHEDTKFQFLLTSKKTVSISMDWILQFSGLPKPYFGLFPNETFQGSRVARPSHRRIATWSTILGFAIFQHLQTIHDTNHELWITTVDRCLRKWEDTSVASSMRYKSSPPKNAQNTSDITEQMLDMLSQIVEVASVYSLHPQYAIAVAQRVTSLEIFKDVEDVAKQCRPPNTEV
ncbi:hypothetical protein DM02DRAFT_633987 [Periconia macrospinosa]|uniref:Uncharacterized protein n=1 Tax=Periconia macrospinosa TaxID=97972 RepID=A0A2V1D7M0_9PLEO|nr:hypothetical protein DM02DRAFT_633987 [Periconia macrospinosa]